MIDAHDYVRKCGWMATVYTHAFANGQPNINIAVTLLQRALTQGVHKIKVQRAHVEVAHFWEIIEGNSVAPTRVFELWKLDPSDPIIVGEFANDPTRNMLIDGHHRYAMATLRGLPYILTWFVPESVWQLYTISGIPDVTLDALRASPPNSIPPRRRPRSNHTHPRRPGP